MSVKFSVHFDQEESHPILYSGESLSGEVRLLLAQPKPLKSISVIVTGNGRVSWTTYKVKPEDHHIEMVEHSDNETYIDCRICSYTSDNGGQFVLSEGEHVYRFKYILPGWLPSSFEGTHGYIRYAVEVILERPWKFDCTFKKPFSVCRSLDLSRDESLALPAQTELRRKFLLTTHKANKVGFLIIQLSVLKTGYSHHETAIPVEVQVANSSGFSLNSLNLQLRKIVQYMCEHPTREKKEEVLVIATTKMDCLVEDDQRRFIIFVEMPMIPPTTITFSRLIQITYELKLEACLPGCTHGNPSVTLPITIGTLLGK